MLLHERVAIGDDTSAAMLHDTLAALGARLIVMVVEQLARGGLAETPQPDEGASYARKLDKDEARIDWSLPAVQIARRIRAFNPAPVAWTELAGAPVRILASTAHASPATRAAPGTGVSPHPGHNRVPS